MLVTISGQFFTLRQLRIDLVSSSRAFLRPQTPACYLHAIHRVSRVSVLRHGVSRWISLSALVMAPRGSMLASGVLALFTLSLTREKCIKHVPWPFLM